MTAGYQTELAKVVTVALAQEELNGIVEVLAQLSKSVDACGCILWEIDPWAMPTANPPVGKLHVYARWFDGHINLPLREVQLQHSANGLAIATETIQNIADMATDPRTFKDRYSIEVANLTSMCVVPIRFDAANVNASLSVYRRQYVRPFSSDEESFIHQVANLIPALYQAIRDRVQRQLLADTSRMLYASEQRAKKNDDVAEIRSGLRSVCFRVAQAFHCLETSIFLENRLESENQFDLVATTHEGWRSERSRYAPNSSDGLTGWVLEHGEPITVFDLVYFQDDLPKLRQKYRNVKWGDSLNIQSLAKKHFKHNLSDGPPLSFMAVPISRDQEVLGVIRCCTATKDPWYFAERQVKLLEGVATLIYRFWQEWLQYLEEKEENAIWENFVEKVRELNDEVRIGFHQALLDEQSLFQRVLSLAKELIGNSDILAIRLYDKKADELLFVSMLATSNDDSINVKVLERIERRFSIDRSQYSVVPPSILTFLDGSPRSLNANVAGYQSETVPETVRLLVVPIGLKNEVIGVLEIRTVTDKPLPAYSSRMAVLLGQQLGLYLALWASEKHQRQVFEDLWHQLKGSVRHTFTRANALLQSIQYKDWHADDADNVEDVHSQLLLLRGVSRKTQRTAINAGIFQALSKEGTLASQKTKMSRLLSNVAIRMLMEAGEDTKSSIDEYREITVYVNRQSFRTLDEVGVFVDLAFFEHAINCLLDNAAKYSFPRSIIRIYGGRSLIRESQYYVFAVRNHGLRLYRDEIPLVTERYHRGMEAVAATGEGSGVGLWVVDHIMKVHGGELEIIPTDAAGITEVRLCFPVIATKGKSGVK
jgi:GAF domain-containing protein/signal transduction histidine kinase